MSVHDSAALAAFQGNGETRLVYARHKSAPDAPRFFLEQGRGGEPGLREYVREHLECPMPGCEDRRLVLVHRSAGLRSKRDGFAHRRGAGKHAPESVWHLAGKEALARWVTARRPNAKVELEVRLGDGERVADVLMSWPIRKMALEVQYSAMSVQQWRERHRWYRNQNIPDVWFFGHVGTHLRPVRTGVGEEPTLFAFSELHRVMVADLQAEQRPPWFWWVNPEAGLLGTAYVRRTLPQRKGYWDTFPTAEDAVFSLAVEPFPEKFLVDNELGIMSPMWGRLIDTDAAYRREKSVVDAEVAEAKRVEAAREAETARLQAAQVAARRAEFQRKVDAAARMKPEDWLPQFEAQRQARARDGVAIATRARMPSGKPRCLACGGNLDPVLARSGYHLGCELPVAPQKASHVPPSQEQERLF